MIFRYRDLQLMFMMWRITGPAFMAIAIIQEMGNDNKANRNKQKPILPGNKKLLQYQKNKTCKKYNKS